MTPFLSSVSRRLFSTSTSIPGLVYQPEFLNKETLQLLREQTLELHDKICVHREGASEYQSQGHNLPFERHYRLLFFEDTPGKKINAQNFIDYGGTGHELTYFIGNHNIPSFIHENIITRIRQMGPVQALSSKKESPLNWRFTFNVYNKENAQQAGFDWHKDIATNGDITSITTIFGNATFQICPEESTDDAEVHSFSLTPGSFVGLTGDSRWKWKHRVLSQETSSLSDRIGRISCVLGCR